MVGTACRSLFAVRGGQIELVPETALARVHETRAPARAGADEGGSGRLSRDLRERAIRAPAAAPILVDGHLWGAFAASWTTDLFPRRCGGAPRGVRRAGRSGDRQTSTPGSS